MRALSIVEAFHAANLVATPGLARTVSVVVAPLLNTFTGPLNALAPLGAVLAHATLSAHAVCTVLSVLVAIVVVGDPAGIQASASAFIAGLSPK